MKAIVSPGDDGRFSPAEVRAAVNPPADLHTPPTRVLSLENTHNGGGGRVWPLDELRAVVVEARRHELAVHLDGARIANAAVASGIPAAAYGREVDTVTICLSKGLGCPLGALLATSRARAGKARRLKHLFGGAMRQAGIVAAAGLYALEHHVERVADDHANARRLANFVLLDVTRLGVAAEDAVARLCAEGVLLSLAARPGFLRAVTHLDVSAADIEHAVAAIPRALSRRAAPTAAGVVPTPY
jgi:threonine aldolase